jgi:hypothetical protein
VDSLLRSACCGSLSRDDTGSNNGDSSKVAHFSMYFDYYERCRVEREGLTEEPKVSDGSAVIEKKCMVDLDGVSKTLGKQRLHTELYTRMTNR